MIGLRAGTRIWIAAGVTDLRRGFTGLSGMVQTALQENPFSGHVFVFRGRWGDLIKMLWSVFFCEATRARKIYLAASHERNRGANSRTVIHASRRDRLAASGAQLRSADGRVKREFIENRFARILFMAYCAHDCCACDASGS